MLALADDENARSELGSALARSDDPSVTASVREALRLSQDPTATQAVDRWEAAHNCADSNSHQPGRLINQVLFGDEQSLLLERMDLLAPKWLDTKSTAD